MINATAILPFDERWFSTALRSIGDAVIATDDRGRVLFLNPVAQSLTGWSDSEALGRPLPEVFSIVNEVTRRPVENPVDKVLATGRVVGLANHTVLIHRDGHDVPIDDSAAPILDDEGQVAGVILVFRDITEKRQAEMLHEQLAAIVQSSDDIIVSESLDGVILSWNRGPNASSVTRPRRSIGKHVSMLMPPGYVEDTEKILGRVRQGEPVDHYETRRRRKDGTIIDVSLTVSPIRNADGEVVGASKIGRDITDLRKSAEMKDQLAAIVESSDDIIASKTLDGIITSWNKGAERILGYTADEVIGKHVSMLMPPEKVEDAHPHPGQDPSRRARGPFSDQAEAQGRHDHRRVVDRLAHSRRLRPDRGGLQDWPRHLSAEANGGRAARGRAPEGRIPRDARSRAEKSPGVDQQRDPAFRNRRVRSRTWSGPRR